MVIYYRYLMFYFMHAALCYSDFEQCSNVANLHVCDNERLDKSDNMAKIRLVFSMINEKCLQYFLHQEERSVDESMLPYFNVIVDSC